MILTKGHIYLTNQAHNCESSYGHLDKEERKNLKLIIKGEHFVCIIGEGRYKKVTKIELHWHSTWAIGILENSLMDSTSY